VNIESVGERIKRQDSGFYDMLQKMTDRPCMYFGADRFDYFQLYLSGYADGCCMDRDIQYFPCTGLQYWLLHTYSATIDGSIKGHSLFYRLFGVSRLAFDQYRLFLDSLVPSDPENVYDEIWNCTESLGIESCYPYDKEGEFSEEYYNGLARDIVDTIKQMIRNTKVTYDQIKIYIRRENLFKQIRFILHTEDGWIDDSNALSLPENHSLLIEIHAKIRSTTAEALCNCGCEVFDEQFYDINKSPTPWKDFLKKISPSRWGFRAGWIRLICCMWVNSMARL
jgi:hypothetical protein